MTTAPIEATAQISVVLTAQEWNAVLGALAEGPFRIVAPLIQQITEQAQAHAQAQPEAQPTAQPAARPNGSTLADPAAARA